ncbi:hypothetical protein VNI00_009653 [Paramarasmius palmivorus]|uniref:Uncharacterized protein n=1 Tax=Paramarasmius palmivorus TaxID=297713 RepID=A0AAW0CLJ5_9AGAR
MSWFCLATPSELTIQLGHGPGASCTSTPKTEDQVRLFPLLPQYLTGSIACLTGFITMSEEEDLRKTVTIVFWYQTNTEPIRLQQTVPKFPLFQLSRFPSLVSDLALTESNYLDTYNHVTGRWDQHTITTTRVVETDQRLLYRIRQSLLQGLKEDECLTLDEELERQPKPQNKRPAPDSAEPIPPSKKRMSSSQSDSVTPKPTTTTSSPPPPQAPVPVYVRPPENSAGYIYQPQAFYSTTVTPEAITLPWHLVNPPTDPAPIPYHPHPPLKRWPNDYTVAQLTQGFYSLEALCSHSHVFVLTPEGERVSTTTPSMSQKTAFERVFGSRYVKSTVCRHRGVWRRAPREIREEFESYGDDERGSWGEFVRRVEGKPPGKAVQHPPQPPMIHPGMLAPGQPMPPPLPPNHDPSMVFHPPYMPPPLSQDPDTNRKQGTTSPEGRPTAPMPVFDPALARGTVGM